MNVLRELARYIKDFLKRSPYLKESYAQEGEDIILEKIFSLQKNGFYVDVGAHHPERFSNTSLLYKKGWRGINIDPMTQCMDLFRLKRPHDINLEMAVFEKKEIKIYYIFNEPALNGFSEPLSSSRDGIYGFKIIGTQEIEGAPLRDILDKHLPVGQEIDLLSVDAEGEDFAVLQSNNWEKYQPRIVIVEILGQTLEEVINSEIAQYIKKQGYHLYSKCIGSCFFISEKYYQDLVKRRGKHGS